MPKKTFKADIEGTEVRFENTWLNGAKLFVDGEIVEHNHSLVAAADNDSPFMAKRIHLNGKRYLIEVFITAAFWSVDFVIKVNGEVVAGDGLIPTSTPQAENSAKESLLGLLAFSIIATWFAAYEVSKSANLVADYSISWFAVLVIIFCALGARHFYKKLSQGEQV